MTPLPLFNLQDYQCPSMFTVTPSSDECRNRCFWAEIPRQVLNSYKTPITSKVHLAFLQHALLVRRNKFKVDLWFDGPNAIERRQQLIHRLNNATDEVLMKQSVYQDFK